MDARLVHRLNLSIGPHSFIWNCCVAPVNDEFILGLDFLEAHQAVIDLPARQLRLKGASIPLTISGSANTQLCSAAFSREFCVAPQSALKAWCVIPPPPEGEPLLLHPTVLPTGLLAPPPEAELPLSSPTTKALWRIRDLLSQEDGILHYHWHASSGSLPENVSRCFVVPRSLVEEVCHCIPSAGHPGQVITLYRRRTRFFWPGMRRDCELRGSRMSRV